MTYAAQESQFNFHHVKGDVLGGLTAGVVTLPLALAFGLQSGLGAVSGLYCAILLGAIAILFGGTRTLISTPTGPMTVVAALTVSQAISIAGSLELALGTIIGIFILAGVVQIVFGLLKIGGNIKYIPYPVLSGFMTGIGIILILFEVFPLMGLSAPSTIYGVFTGAAQALRDMNIQALALGGLTLVILYAAPKVSTTIPAALMALLVGTFLALATGLSVPLIGEVSQGLPSFQFERLLNVDVSQPSFIITAALTLGALGCIDTLLTAVIVDKITETKHQSNRELIGQGMGNVASALFGGLPGAGTTMSSIVNVKAGGRTRLAGVVSSLFLLTVLLGLGAYVQFVPIPVLAAILITVGLDIIDYKGLKEVVKVDRAESAILFIVLFLTVFVDLITAVGAGMTLSVFVFMKKMGDIGEEKIVLFPLRSLKIRKPCDLREEFVLPQDYLDTVYIKTFTGPVFFGFSHFLIDNVKQLPTVNILIFEMNRVPYLDQSAAHALELVFEYMQKRGIRVLLANINPQPLEMLRAVDLTPRIVPEHHIFEDIFDCVRWLEEEFVSDKTTLNPRVI
ncbi:SulP family inorganic anion transporter [Candidatus Nitrospira neomarina]|uniref:SulP family inorganic anion transporter n=1 Tax=Candidatus Nitrospira neomarina TaxID=3020899 RepID=A0AA96GKW3_9BACT|nr:SulP family inorganic anion transporter [Candidatus Nitrospira neomarina]WNM60918.1 SulP family inorganic anion transporter [Candidatus Nitrospira neomarina]